MTLPRPEDSRAVLIGVSSYTQLPQLAAVRNSIETLRDILTCSASWNLSPEHCTVVHDPRTPEELVDPILHGAEEASDTLLVYYAGHGLKGPNRGELRLSRSTSRAGAPHTSTDYNDIRETLLGSTASRRIVILDCCYAASALGTMTDPASSIADDALIEGTYLIAAAGETEAAMAEDGSGFTVFTGELIRLLSEGIPDSTHDLLDLDTVFSYLYSTLRAKSRPLPHKRVRNSLGKLALARNSFRHAGKWTIMGENQVTFPGISRSQSEGTLLPGGGQRSEHLDPSEPSGTPLAQTVAQLQTSAAPPLVASAGLASAPSEPTVSLVGKTAATDPASTPLTPAGSVTWPTARRPRSTVETSPNSQHARYVEILWQGILERIKERRRFAWIILAQNAKISSFDGETLELSFTNAAARDSYRSTGIDELLNHVINDDLKLEWKVKVSVALDPKLDQQILGSPSKTRRPGEWPALSVNSGAVQPATGQDEEPQPVPISWPPVRKPPPPEDFQRIQELWPKVLDEIGKRRRTFWYLLSHDCRPVGAVGKSIFLGFDNEQSRLAYLSSGADKLLEDVATEILRFACKIEPVMLSE
ncbi:hypothetical protein SUDANB135_03802 [Streptomyces sp. SudanB135_2055]|nr:caspase family protein [Streptomyces sp. CS207]